jgi:hypothetical protein
MARKRAPKNNKPKNARNAKRTPRTAGGDISFFRVLFSRPVRNIILIIAAIILLAVFWDEGFFQSLRVQLGWGVIFVAGAIVTLIVLLWQGQLGSLVASLEPLAGGHRLRAGSVGHTGTHRISQRLLQQRLGGRFGYNLVNKPSPAAPWTPSGARSSYWGCLSSASS